MKAARQFVKTFLKDESGQSLLEYALIAALIGLAAIVTLTALGSKISTAFNTIGSDITNAI